MNFQKVYITNFQVTLGTIILMPEIARNLCFFCAQNLIYLYILNSFNRKTGENIGKKETLKML